jgi:MYXO-CTERM domain-containing protein
MKAIKFFSMGLLLPFMAAWLYAGEASATSNKGPFRATYCKSACKVTKYEKESFYYVTDPDHDRICVKTWDVPKGKIRKGYQCWIKLPGAANYVEFDCKFTASSGWIKNIPVKHGYNEVRIYAITKDGERSIPLDAGWYVKAEAEQPVPRIWIGPNVGALPNGPGGSCNPLTIPIVAENGSHIHYIINGREYSTAELNELGAPAKPPFLVDYDLQTQGITSLAPGETMTMFIWAEDSIPKNTKVKKCIKTKKVDLLVVRSVGEEWTVQCPPPPPSYLMQIDPPVVRSGYASRATLHFSEIGGATPPVFCSLNGSPAVACETLNSQFYSGLTAGPQLFSVYATPGNITDHRWIVFPPDVVWTLALPVDSTSTSATFGFEPVRGVDVPATLWCRLNSGPIEVCTSPRQLNNLPAGENVFEVYAISSVGTGEVLRHTWAVLEAGGGGGIRPSFSSPLEGGCSTAVGMPLGLIALAGLWAARRRRT